MKFRHKYSWVQPRTKLSETHCKIASVSSKPSLSPCFTMLILIVVFSSSHAENKNTNFFSCHPEKHTNHRLNIVLSPNVGFETKTTLNRGGEGVTLFCLEEIFLRRETGEQMCKVAP